MGIWRKQRNEAGTTVIEFAIVAPMLALIAFGLVEMGLLYNHSDDIGQAARAGARAAASTSDAEAADDFYVLSSIRGDSSLMNKGTIEKVIVYKAGADGSMNPACNTGSVAGSCNVYSAAQMNSANLGTVLESAWSPSSRSTAPGASDYVGVKIIATHKWATGVLPGAIKVSGNLVMRIEPGVIVDETVPGLDATSGVPDYNGGSKVDGGPPKKGGNY